MGLGVVEGTLVKLKEREREKGTMNERDQLEKKREMHDRFKRKVKRQFKSGCTR